MPQVTCQDGQVEASSVPTGRVGRVKSITYCRVGEVGPVLPFLFLYPPDNGLLEGLEPGHGLYLLQWNWTGVGGR